jgi:acetyl esterase/lipase
MPSKQGNAPRPALVIIHGGGWRNGDKRAGSFLNSTLSYAAKGYVCITVNYRLLKEESDTIAQCVEDVKNAVRWLRAHAEKYNVDPKTSTTCYSATVQGTEYSNVT